MRVEYKQTPQQVLIAQMNRFIQESQVPGWTVQLRWVRLEDNEPESSAGEDTQLEEETGGYKHSERLRISNTYFFPANTFPSHPNGYRESRSYPILRGRNSCQHCLCSPCVISLPPDFLRGAYPANDEK